MICVYNQEDKKRMGPKEKAFLNKFFGVSNDQEYNSEFNADNPSFKPGLNTNHSSSIKNTSKNYFDQTWEKEHQINLPSKNPGENQPPKIKEIKEIKEIKKIKEIKEIAPQVFLKLNKKKTLQNLDNVSPEDDYNKNADKDETIGEVNNMTREREQENVHRLLYSKNGPDVLAQENPLKDSSEDCLSYERGFSDGGERINHPIDENLVKENINSKKKISPDKSTCGSRKPTLKGNRERRNTKNVTEGIKSLKSELGFNNETVYSDDIDGDKGHTSIDIYYLHTEETKQKGNKEIVPGEKQNSFWPIKKEEMEPKIRNMEFYKEYGFNNSASPTSQKNLVTLRDLFTKFIVNQCLQSKTNSEKNVRKPHIKESKKSVKEKTPDWDYNWTLVDKKRLINGSKNAIKQLFKANYIEKNFEQTFVQNSIQNNTSSKLLNAEFYTNKTLEELSNDTKKVLFQNLMLGENINIADLHLYQEPLNQNPYSVPHTNSNPHVGENKNPTIDEDRVTNPPHEEGSPEAESNQLAEMIGKTLAEQLVMFQENPDFKAQQIKAFVGDVEGELFSSLSTFLWHGFFLQKDERERLPITTPSSLTPVLVANIVNNFPFVLLWYISIERSPEEMQDLVTYLANLLEYIEQLQVFQPMLNLSETTFRTIQEYLELLLLEKQLGIIPTKEKIKLIEEFVSRYDVISNDEKIEILQKLIQQIWNALSNKTRETDQEGQEQYLDSENISDPDLDSENISDPDFKQNSDSDNILNIDSGGGPQNIQKMFLKEKHINAKSTKKIFCTGP